MTARTVDAIRTHRDRARQMPGRRCAVSKYHARPKMKMVNPKRGTPSARNAGVAASPAPVTPKRPSAPGMTHHQGRGTKAPIGASNRSTWKILGTVWVSSRS